MDLLRQLDTETEVADQIFNPTQPQKPDTVPANPSTDPTMLSTK